MRRVRFLAVALALALVLMGAGYAAWSEDIPINGAMATGELRWTVSNFERFEEDFNATSLDFIANPDFEITQTDKNVGETSGALVAEANGDVHTVNVITTNAYPGYCSWFRFVVTNNGTIPVRIQQPVITGPAELLVVYDGAEGAGTGEVLSSGEATTLYYKYRVNESAQENSSYTFTINTPGVQWNH